MLKPVLQYFFDPNFNLEHVATFRTVLMPEGTTRSITLLQEKVTQLRIIEHCTPVFLTPLIRVEAEPLSGCH